MVGALNFTVSKLVVIEKQPISLTACVRCRAESKWRQSEIELDP